MIKTTTLAQKSENARIRYENLLEDAMFSDNDRIREYSHNEIERYHYLRPKRNAIERIAGRMLGPVPSRLTLWMTTVKRDTPLGITTLVASMGTLAGLCLLYPVLSISPFLWLLEASSHFGIIAVAVVAVIVFFEVMVISVKSYTEIYDNSVIASNGMAEELSAEYELFHRAGAERWSLKQRIASVLLGALFFNFFLTIFMPVAFSIVMIILNTLLLSKYLLSYRRYGDSALATIEVAKLGGTLRRFGYLLVAEGCLLVIVGISQYMPNFAETFSKAFS